MKKIRMSIQYMILMSRARHRDPNSIQGHWHHVYMQSLAGTSSEIVKLTYEEHFRAHKILAQTNPDIDECVYAYRFMATRVNGKLQHNDYYEVTAEEYAESCKMFSEKFSGENAPGWKGGVSKDRNHMRKLVNECHARHKDEYAEITRRWYKTPMGKWFDYKKHLRHDIKYNKKITKRRLDEFKKRCDEVGKDFEKELKEIKFYDN